MRLKTVRLFYSFIITTIISINLLAQKTAMYKDYNDLYVFDKRSIR